MPVEVFGYSERGMINAIIYEMKYAADGISLFRDSSASARFLLRIPNPISATSGTPRSSSSSFFGFGDLDVLFLLDDADGQAFQSFSGSEGQDLPEELLADCR